MAIQKHVALQLSPGKGSVLVDGVDIGPAVTDLVLRADARNRALELQLVTHDVTVDGVTSVAIPQETRAALLTLGWTPPVLDHADADELCRVLQLITEHDTDYEIRYLLVFKALDLALGLGYAAGFAPDPAEPDWPVAYIELPTGQVSWHMPKHTVEFDGHSTGGKYRRVREFIASQRGLR
ncbi:hypothetical protein [Umezawaea tangerina]|uniref:Uncharacterized protein n=1 Tax=Umezawaea tangerina TaxID=84725 RepID=A0A2T0SPM8_9PSEU|nr:hypothetical protein [Umezawaea tangerina]PRY35369.1 hypothetical protein CLV43_114287 [Umezawaea tangerina]